jgi:sugar lactone lactonase YvrE
VEVVRQGEGLVLRRFGRDVPMHPSAPDRFRVDLPRGGDETIAFGSGADGHADYLHMNVWALARVRQPSGPAARLARLLELNTQARTAHAGGDRATFLRASEGAAALAPELPNQLYNLACAQALNEQGDAAVATLHRLAAAGVVFDLAADTDFASVASRPDFRAVADRMKTTGAAAKGTSPILFTLRERDLITEGVAIDSSTGDLFVSAAYRRKVVRVKRSGGTYRASDFIGEGQDGLQGATGIEVDAARRRLWVCSSTRPQMHGGKPDDPRRAEIIAFDLATGTLASRHPIAGGEPGHGCDSLTVARDGTVYASDPEARVVWRLQAGASAPVSLVQAGVLPAPQDLALSPKQDSLYVADYARGVFRVALPSGELHWLSAPPGFALTGIDGLELDARAHRLIAIQNGIRPHRIVALELDPAGAAIVRGTVLAQNIDGWDEPTLGTIAGDELIYVGRSQWRFFDREGNLESAQELAEPAVFRMRLDGTPPR